MTTPAGSARICSSGASETPPPGARAPPRSAEAAAPGRARNRRCRCHPPSAIRHPSRSPPSAPEPRTRRNRSSTTTRRARGARSARSRASSRTSAPVPSPRRRRRRRLRASAASAPPSCAPPPPTRARVHRAGAPVRGGRPGRRGGHVVARVVPTGRGRRGGARGRRRWDARARPSRRQRAGGDPRRGSPAARIQPAPRAPLRARAHGRAGRNARPGDVPREPRGGVAGGQRARGDDARSRGRRGRGALRWTDPAAFRDAGSVSSSFDAFGVGDFARNECAWNETARALDASATSDGRGRSLATGSTPTGPRAQAAAASDERRRRNSALQRGVPLGARGMMDAARELCVRAGQPWRAASLGGAAPGPGGFAPAPVGAAADAAFAASAAFPVAAATEAARRARARRDPPWTRMDAKLSPRRIRVSTTRPRSRRSPRPRTRPRRTPRTRSSPPSARRGLRELKFPNLGSQVGARRRALWKWACAETARQILAAPTAAPSARLEAALHGACAGDVRATLPACEGDWEASAWAYFDALDARGTPPSMARGPRARMRLSRGRGRGRAPRCWTTTTRARARRTTPRLRLRPGGPPPSAAATRGPLRRYWRRCARSPRASARRARQAGAARRAAVPHPGAHARTRRRGGAPVGVPVRVRGGL